MKVYLVKKSNEVRNMFGENKGISGEAWLLWKELLGDLDRIFSYEIELDDEDFHNDCHIRYYFCDEDNFITMLEDLQECMELKMFSEEGYNRATTFINECISLIKSGSCNYVVFNNN